MDGQGGGGFLPGWSWLLWLHIRETNGLRGEKKKQAPFLSHLLVTYYEKCVCVCVSLCTFFSSARGLRNKILNSAYVRT